jgi:hypothetical protein
MIFQFVHWLLLFGIDHIVMEREEHAMGPVDGQCQIVSVLHCNHASNYAIIQIIVQLPRR